MGVPYLSCLDSDMCHEWFMECISIDISILRWISSPYNHECWFFFSPSSASVLSACVCWAGPGMRDSHDPVSGQRWERERLMTPGPPHNHIQPASEQTWAIVTGTVAARNRVYRVWEDCCILCYLCTLVLFILAMDVKVNNNDSTWLQPPASQGQLPLYYLDSRSWNGKKDQIKCKSVRI